MLRRTVSCVSDLDLDGLDFDAEDEADSALNDLLSAHRTGGSASTATYPAVASSTASDAAEQEHEWALKAALSVSQDAEAETDEPQQAAQGAGWDDEGDDLPDDEPAEAGSESAEEDFSAEAVAADPEDQDVDTAVEEALAAAQDAAAGRSSLLPVTGFKVAGHSGSQMQVRAMPEVFSQALRTTITEAAISAGHRRGEAELFATKLSQAALVTALLFARLQVNDLKLEDLDDSTAMAVQLFRRTDPLQAALVSAFEHMATRETVRDRRLARLESNQRQIISTTATIEHMQAFAIVDKQDNLLRGQHSSMDIDVSEQSVIGLRDRSRHQVKTQLQREKDREGRKR